MFKIHRSDKNESVKKSIQKILDPKKDVVTRLKHLKLILGKLIVILMCVNYILRVFSYNNKNKNNILLLKFCAFKKNQLEWKEI